MPPSAMGCRLWAEPSLTNSAYGWTSSTSTTRSKRLLPLQQVANFGQQRNIGGRGRLCLHHFFLPGHPYPGRVNCLYQAKHDEGQKYEVDEHRKEVSPR